MLAASSVGYWGTIESMKVHPREDRMAADRAALHPLVDELPEAWWPAPR